MNKDWQKISDDFKKLSKLFSLKEKIKRKKDLEEKINQPQFWQIPEKAKKISQEAEKLDFFINKMKILEDKIKEAIDLEKLANREKDLEVIKDLEKTKLKIEEELMKLEDEALFSSKFDSYDVFLSIHAGTGGVDAQDWASMLERMYLRFAEKMNWSAKIVDKIYGQEAGIKSSLLKISGYYPYGWLKSEHGVHRLGRISPFDGEALRQTSFALVEVLPDLGDEKEISLRDEDIKIDVFRSSGPGGQSVNTTDSAVRVTHLPSNIIVSCQSERSQYQNKQNALNLLKAKLYKLKLEKKDDLKSDLKGDNLKAEWGKQIRSYILYGNQIVKDHRSQLEKKDPSKVLDGDLKEFALAYLKLKTER